MRGERSQRLRKYRQGGDVGRFLSRVLAPPGIKGSLLSRVVAPPGTKRPRGLLSRLEPPSETKSSFFIPVGAYNRDKRPLSPRWPG